MRASPVLLSLLAGFVTAVAGRAAEPVPAVAPAVASATIPMTRQIDFTSTVNGRAYRIQIATPLAPAPEKGFPVLYVLDGDGYFGTYSAAVRLRGMSHEIEPAVVVGIGYPDAETDLTVALRRRELDLTPTDADAETKAMPPMTKGAPEYAGADALLRVIETEIKPRVAAVIAVDPGRTALFGHSLGGLFVLHSLFTHPTAFRTWLALSPSIWWNHRAVLAEEDGFARQVMEHKAAPKLFVAVGGNEQMTPPPPYPPGMTRATVEAMMTRAAMVDSARALAARLGALKGTAEYEVGAKVFDGESHNSVAWQSVNALLNFTLPPPTPAN